MERELRLLERYLGGWWCGVRFRAAAGDEDRLAARPMRFCEAVAASRTGPVTLVPESMECPGGSRCLGWNSGEETIARMMVEKAGLDPETARRILLETPRLEEAPEKVTVGVRDDPDVVISFGQPAAVMSLLRERQRSQGGSPVKAEISGFMSVCGAVAVKTFLTRRICISFGCVDAREYGTIGRDRLIVGLPAESVPSLARGLSEQLRKGRA